MVDDQPFGMASGAGGSADPDASAPSVVPPWLLKAKVVAPEPAKGYLRRASLLQRLDGLLERRLTVLRAPAGFGKTTVLADVAHGAKEQGLVVAWISLDDDDTPNIFGSYLAAAFEHAGLDLTPLNAHDAWASSPAVQQMGMLARAIEAHQTPCLVVLDEVDRVPRRTVQLIDLLLKRAPPNLHVAMAFRFDPGLDLAPHILDGGAVVVGARELRFSRTDIARFFRGDLSRQELARVESLTAGWAAALMVHRNLRGNEAGVFDEGTARLTEEYVGARLLRDLSDEDRSSLLDMAVFDWIDADLVDEVLGSSNARMRVGKLPVLDGLLSPIGGDRALQRLHPLLRDYCLDLLSVEDPARKRTLHERIALALVRRGQLTPAWRHATATGDGRLVSELIERFGVFQLWLWEGVTRLISAGRFLTPALMASYPRLELLYCLILRLSSRFDEANALFEAVARKTEGFTHDRDGGDANALAVDRVFTQGMLTGGAYRLPSGELDASLPTGGIVAGGGEPARTVTLARHTLLCMVCYQRARFAESRRHGLQAQAHFTEDVRFGDVFVNICLGMSAMAQGRVQEATAWYKRARQGIRKFFSADPCLAVGVDVLTIELDLERNRERAIQQRTLNNLTEVRGVWIDVYAAAIAVSAELMFVQYDGESVIELLTKAVDDARGTSIESLSNHMAALQAYYLMEAGRPDEAGRLWRDRQLPRGVSELLDLDRQSWRTMEALSCARIRLLAEQGEYAAAEELANRLCGAASDHGLTRTQLRGLALWMDAAHRAGHTDQALARLADFLRITRDVDYVRPLVRHREVSRTVLRRLLDTDLDDDTREAAESTLAHVDGSAATPAPIFSARELEVLAEVGRGRRNKDIAGRLGISDDGVRYHLKNIYRKTDTGKRADAVRYAQSLGVLS